MANTKTHPGAFRCYEAALPDEPMFVILGRDPAGPATLEFWAQERVKQQKVHEPDDQARIKAAIDEAKDMQDWRDLHLDPTGDGRPSWKLPRPGYADWERPPVAVWQGDVGNLFRVPGVEGTQTMDQIAEVYRQHAQMTAELAMQALTRSSPDDDNKSDYQILRSFEDAVKDYSQDPKAISDTLRRMRVGSGPHEGGMIRMPDGENMTYESIVDLYEKRKAEWSAMISRPPAAPVEDLAKSPDLPPHRFAQFFKAGRYAYAKGLEVNPTHLPQALDAMAADGWKLLSIFGATDSKNVGFIFEREITSLTIPSTLTVEDIERIKASVAEYCPPLTPAPVADPTPSPAMQAYQNGDPMDKIMEAWREQEDDSRAPCRVNIGIHGGIYDTRLRLARKLERILMSFDDTDAFRVAMFAGANPKPVSVFMHTYSGDTGHRIQTTRSLWNDCPPGVDCTDRGRGLEP